MKFRKNTVNRSQGNLRIKHFKSRAYCSSLAALFAQSSDVTCYFFAFFH